MSVRWITPTLATAAWEECSAAPLAVVVDVRSLRDASGNSPELLAQKIAEVEAHVRAGRRTVVCCDHGKSRSNAVAAAALARIDGSGFSAALERVLMATGERAIKLDLLGDVRHALGESGGPRTERDEAPVLLCSAEGFMGRALETAFSRSGQAVRAVDSQITLANPALLEQLARSSGARCLVLLSRPSAPDTNDGMGELLGRLRGALEVCRACELRLVFLSGHQVYRGCHGPKLRAYEDLPRCPEGALGDALSLAEELIEVYGERNGVRALVVRTCTVYGPRDERPGFLRTFILTALRGEDIVTHRYRNGSPIVELLHVRDFASGIVLAVRKRLTGRLHLGKGEGITTLHLAELIVRLAGSTSSIRSVDLRGDAVNIVLDTSRAAASIGWTPETELENGILEQLSDFRSADQNKETIRP